MAANLFRFLAILLAVLCSVIDYLLRRKRKLCYYLLPILSLALLFFKIGDLIYLISAGLYYPPYEISHLAYYVVPILILLGLPGSDFAAGSLSFIVGVGFLLGAIIKPDSLIALMSLYGEIRLLITHELFYAMAWPLLFSFRRFRAKDYGAFLAMMAGFLVYFLLLRYHVIYPSEDYNSYSIALGVMDGSLVRYLASDPSLFLCIIFAISCLILIFGVPLCLFFLGRALWASRLKKGLFVHDELPLWARYGLVPYFLKAKEKKSQVAGTSSFAELESTIYA
jgi:hypothetical protein